MKRSMLLSLCVAIAAQSAVADEPPTLPHPPSINEVRAACDADVQKLCAGVQPGGGRILACLKERKEAVSDGCKQALDKAKPSHS